MHPQSSHKALKSEYMNANSGAGCVKNTCRIEVGLMRIFLLNSHAASKCFSSELQFSFLGPDNNTVFDSNIELNGHHYRWGQLIKPNSCLCFDFLSLHVVFVIKKVPSFPVYTQLNTNIFLCLGQRASDWSAWGSQRGFIVSAILICSVSHNLSTSIGASLMLLWMSGNKSLQLGSWTCMNNGWMAIACWSYNVKVKRGLLPDSNPTAITEVDCLKDTDEIHA